MRSAPTMHDAKEAIAAHVYTRQLYTALGVGLSSTKVRRPIFDAISSRRWVVGVSRWQSNQRWGVLSAGRAAHLYNKASFPSFSRTMPPFRHRTIWKQRGDMSSRIWGAGEEEKVRELWGKGVPMEAEETSSTGRLLFPPCPARPFSFLDDHPAPWSGWRGVTLRGGGEGVWSGHIASILDYFFCRFNLHCFEYISLRWLTADSISTSLSRVYPYSCYGFDHKALKSHECRTKQTVPTWHHPKPQGRITSTALGTSSATPSPTPCPRSCIKPSSQVWASTETISFYPRWTWRTSYH